MKLFVILRKIHCIHDHFSEQRIRQNTLYQELSFQDNDALGEMDEGADISGIFSLENCFLSHFFCMFVCVFENFWHIPWCFFMQKSTVWKSSMFLFQKDNKIIFKIWQEKKKVKLVEERNVFSFLSYLTVFHTGNHAGSEISIGKFPTKK